MFRLIIMLTCLCLAGSQLPASVEFADFEKKQIQVIQETDHQKIFQDCQELMRSSIGFGITGNSYFYGDPNYLSKLPESIRSLEPIYVHVNEMFVSVNFMSPVNHQYIEYHSNEFGDHGPRYGDFKGQGWRSDPVKMENLTGNETLEYLNKEFEWLQMELAPGIIYWRFKNEESHTPEEYKLRKQQMISMWQWMDELSDKLILQKRRLLYKTDHEELLKACRYLIKKHNQGVIVSNINTGKESTDKNLKYVPDIILNLEPLSLRFYENCVDIVFMGGFDHIGAIAYLGNEPEDKKDNMILTKGLYYYEEGLNKTTDEYKDYLEDLKKEAISYRDWKRKQKKLSKEQ